MYVLVFQYPARFERPSKRRNYTKKEMSKSIQKKIKALYSVNAKEKKIITNRLTNVGKHLFHIFSVAYSPNGNLIATGSVDKTIKIWNAVDMREEFTLRGHNSTVTSVSFSPSSQFLASSSWDQSIRIWNLNTQTLSSILIGQCEGIVSMSYSPNGRSLVSVSDTIIMFWDIETKFELFHIQESYFSCACFSPSGKFLFTGGDDSKLKIWSIEKQCQIYSNEFTSGYIISLSFNTDRKLVAIGFENCSIKILDIITYQIVRNFVGHIGCVNSLLFLPDGNYLASGSDDNSVKIWNIEYLDLETELFGNTSAVLSVCFDPSGKFVASGSENGSLLIWNFENLSRIISQREIKSNLRLNRSLIKNKLKVQNLIVIHIKPQKFFGVRISRNNRYFVKIIVFSILFV